MSESHLFAALRYVELNPVRAGMAAAAWDWPWSSARAHAIGEDDATLCLDWAERLGRWDHREWTEILAAGCGDGECEALRRATWKGEPLGSREFVHELEPRTGKRLRVGEPGRPRKKPAEQERCEQGLLFAAGE